MGEPSIAREMRPNRHTLDEDSASRLLQGHVHPDDAPPGYSAVAGLLNSAAQLSLGPVGEEAAAITVSAMVEVIRDAPPTPETSRRKTMLGKLLAGKALAAVAVLGLTATGAAAGTGALPDPAQNAVSEAVSHVGIEIPRGNSKSAAHRKDAENRNKNNKPADEGQPADDANGMSGKVEELKQQIDDGTLEGPLGQQVCKEASNGACVHENGDTGDDEGDTANAGASTENKGVNSADPSGKSGDDHGKPEDTPAKPETPGGSIATGAENSERDVPSGSGKPE
jgi:hypothetical protein